VKLHLKLADLTHTLEQQVEERTAALSRSLQQLQSTQLQLVQSEKMSALGQLIAGVGHEINNPINFITGNLPHINHYTQDLLKLVHLYQEKLPEPDAEITQLIEEIDLDYLRKDVTKLIASMQEGSKRLEDISLSLRTFARADVSFNQTAFRVHDGINSTLVLLKHRTKSNEKRPEIAVIKEYGDLPPIQCYPGQLNQVFMNLIANAIDAIDELSAVRTYAEVVQHANTITIRTAVSSTGKNITISITDNAGGMSPEVQAQIFDPAFTTKAVGKGTGLGLPISKQIIVDKHQGQLDCCSQPEFGTEFIITLPI
jgi:signal transduction histidine kinase